MGHQNRLQSAGGEIRRRNLNGSVTKYIQRYCPFTAERTNRQALKWT